VRSDIVPPNRFITIALVIGILALIAYGAYAQNPATLVIIAALILFIAGPALLVFILNRRARLRPPSLADDSDAANPPNDLDQPDLR
jgi:hypothetical protein